MVITEWKTAAGTVNVSDVAEKRGAVLDRVDGVVKERAGVAPPGRHRGAADQPDHA